MKILPKQVDLQHIWWYSCPTKKNKKKWQELFAMPTTEPHSCDFLVKFYAQIGETFIKCGFKEKDVIYRCKYLKALFVAHYCEKMLIDSALVSILSGHSDFYPLQPSFDDALNMDGFIEQNVKDIISFMMPHIQDVLDISDIDEPEITLSKVMETCKNILQWGLQSYFLMGCEGKVVNYRSDIFLKAIHCDINFYLEFEKNYV